MNTKSKILSTALVVALSTAFLYATGPAGCGGSGGDTGAAGSSGTPSGSSTLTVNQQEELLDVLSTTMKKRTPSTVAALTLEDEMKDVFPTTVDCVNGGHFTINQATPVTTLHTDNCGFMEGAAPFNSARDLVINGDLILTMISSNHQTVRYGSSYTATRGARSCSFSGGLDTVILSFSPFSSTSDLNISGICNGHAFTETGNIASSIVSSGTGGSGGGGGSSGYTDPETLVTGDVTFTVGGASQVCHFVNFNGARATCAELATACSIATSLCL